MVATINKRLEAIERQLNPPEGDIIRVVVVDSGGTRRDARTGEIAPTVPGEKVVGVGIDLAEV